MVLVAVQLSVLDCISAGVQMTESVIIPPQTIISVPVHTAVWEYRAIGRVGGAGRSPTVRVGLYLPPALNHRQLIAEFRPRRSSHCRSNRRVTGSRGRVHWWWSWLSNYPCLDYIFRRCSTREIVIITPPQTIISLPVHTAV